MGIVKTAVSKFRTTLLVMIFLIIMGMFGRAAMPIASNPNIQFPFVNISVFLEGASPEDMARIVAKPLENRFLRLEGQEQVRSTNTQSFTNLTIQYDVDYDMDQAILDVERAIGEVRNQLPPEANDPIVRERSDNDWPILIYSIYGFSNLRSGYAVAQEIQDRFEKVPGVLGVEIGGVPEELLEVEVSQAKLESLGVSLTEIYSAVRNNNVLIPAGFQDTGSGKFAVEIPSIFETRQDVFDLPIKSDGNKVVKMGDVADIKRTFKDFTSYARVNGEDAVTLEISLRESANAIDASNAIRDILYDFEKTLPSNLNIVVSNDDTIYANLMVKELNGNIIAAVVLIMVLVIASMGTRVSMLVGLSIPFCFLMTYLILYTLDMEVNFLVMMGLLLGMGMLIDGSIVITEYADKKIAEGLSRVEGYTLASKRMFYPIIASTGTTLAAFIPMMFWPGFTGQFMKYLPITIFFVLSASLFYSLIVIPVLGAYFGQKESALNSDEGHTSVFVRLTEWYGKYIKRFVRNPIETVTAVISLLLVIILSYSISGMGTIYFAIVDPIQANVTIKARGNFSALETKEIIEQVEERFLKVEGIKNVYLRSGSNWWESGSDRVGGGFIETLEPSQTKISGFEIMDLLKESTNDLPGITVEIEADEGGPSFDSPIEIDIFGDTEEQVNEAVTKIENHMRNNMSGLNNIFSSKAYPSVEWSVEVDKQKAAQLGVSVSDVGALVQMLTSGFKVGEYRPDDAKDEVEIRARFPDSDRTITGIRDLNVVTRQGTVPVSSFVQVVPKENRQTVNRKNGKYFQEIGAGTEDESKVSEKINELSFWLESIDLGPGISYKFSGMAEETEDVNRFIVIAGITAIFMMLLMLITQFNSFYQSFIILSAVTISFVGVLLGLLITGKSFSTTMTGISIVTLAGIVVNNNIVLIDTFNKLREEAPQVEQAVHIINACKQRLRPIILTSLTTIFGLLPLAMGVSLDIISRDIVIGSRVVDWWSNLAVSIVWGLGFSTFMTLILTPAVLSLPYALRNEYKKFFKIEANDLQ